MNEIRTAVSELVSDLLTIRCLLSSRTFQQPAQTTAKLRQLATEVKALHSRILEALR